MAIELIQGEGGYVVLGPFLDATDGVTPETGLTINNTDILIWKAGAASLVAKNSGGATHLSGGLYRINLDATDTNTQGALEIYCHVAGALPVKASCHVNPTSVRMEHNYWNHLVYFTAAGTPTPSSIQIGAVSFSYWTSAHNNDGAYVGMNLMVLGYSTISRVVAYNGTTQVLTIDPPLPFTPSSGDSFMLVPGSPGTLADGAISAGKIAANAIDADALAADAVAEIQSGLATDSALATVDGIVDAILEDTGTTLPTTLATILAYVDELESRLTATRAGYLDALNSGAPLSAAAVDAILDEVVEGSVTLRQSVRLFLSVMTGKSSGGDTTSVTFRDIADTKNRLVFTVDANGNRTAVGTRDGS